MRAAKSGREDMRRDHGHQRIGPGNACPCSNEREHIRIAVDDTLPTASKKRPAAPEHYWCRKRKLDPVKHAMRQDVTESHPYVTQHGDQDERHRAQRRDNEPPPHVKKFFRRSFRPRRPLTSAESRRGKKG